MFGSRRHRPPNPPLTTATANPNAATAAAAVFKRHEESNSSLSAAAAAAALRARPTTPTRVADVQTKRTLRRSASVASTGTASDQGRDPSGLRRRDSSGSMTERTFRTPSPHRPASSGSVQRRSQSFGGDMPPVPALPRHMDAAPGQSGGAAQPQAQVRRANTVSLGTAPLRLASQKLASDEAPSWFGAAKLGDLGNIRRTDPAMASPPSSPLQPFTREDDLPEGARPGSQASSINFSYPTRMRRGSANAVPTVDPHAVTQVPGHTGKVQPPAQGQPSSQATRAANQPRAQPTAPAPKKRPASSSSDQPLVYDPNSRRMVPQADLLAVQHAVLEAAQVPTRPKKKKKTPARAGSHLAAGTTGRAKIHVPDPAPAARITPSSGVAQAQPSRQVQPIPPMEAAPTQETRVHVEESAVETVITSPRLEASRPEQRHQPATELPRSTAPALSDSAQSAVRRQPSVVREEPELEDLGDGGQTQKVISDALDAVPGRRRMQAGTRLESSSRASPTLKITVPRSSISQVPPAAQVDQRHETASVHVSEDGKPKPGVAEHKRAAHVSRERAHSNSPVRQAHFGPVQDSLTVKHSPPPRSISPRKSAMKHTSPPRAASPSDDTSEASESLNQEAPVTRRKSVRVSFDDGAIGAPGDSASASRNGSPMASSPIYTNNRNSWLSNPGRGQDLPSLDDDVVMKPRPALPSFGSVRDIKPRETNPTQSERPLVRPKGETRYSSALLPSPPLGSSKDHALGAVLSREQARLKDRTQHTEGAPRHREPLPPVVITVEGTGYFSDSSDNSSLLSSEFEQSEASLPTRAAELRSEPTAASQTSLPKTPVNGSAVRPGQEVVLPQAAIEQEASPEPEIPTIAVSQPTPPPGAKSKSPGQSLMDVPGGFPEDESDQSAASAAKRSAQVMTAAQPAKVAPENQQPAQPTPESTQSAAAEDSSDSDSDMFSDAYEDLSEIEGDGFQSLDAVVESSLQRRPQPSSQPERVSSDAAGHESVQESLTLQTQISSATTAAGHGSVEEPPKLQAQISSATTVVETPPAESPQDEWERAKAYWRSLTAEKRAQLEREAMEEAGVEADRDEAQSESEARKKKTVERAFSEAKVLTVHTAQQTSGRQEQGRTKDPARTYMIKPGERWTGGDESDVAPMRKPMRDQPQRQAMVQSAEGSRSRKPMRPSGPSVPSNEDYPNPVERRASKRPLSSPPAAATLTKHSRSATQAEPTSREADTLQPPMARRGSTGSESSFKRLWPAKAQGIGFRHSLRPTSPPSVQGDQRLKRFSLRTLSPAGSDSRQNADSLLANATASTHIRTTLRNQAAGRKSSGGIRIPSFGLSYGGGKKPGSKTSGNKGSASRFSSRFADSSDEEGPTGFPSGFRSRFEDSSDDEPVVPIPAALPNPTSAPHAAAHNAGHHLRKESSIASTALPEELEDSEEPQGHGGATTQPNGRPPPTSVDTALELRRTRSGRGQLPGGSHTLPSLSRTAISSTNNDGRPSSTKRNSLMSVLRHRKKDSAAAKIGRPEISESAARRDTRLERSVGQLERIRSLRGGADEGREEEGVDEAVPSSSPAALPRSPRLQKRGTKRVSAGVVVGSRTVGVAAAVVAAPPAVRASGTDHEIFLGDRGEDMDEFIPAPPRRSSTSGNLGTRTLSGGGGGFFHLHPHRRVASVGLEAAPPSVEGSSVAGSMAGASSTTRKKRFGALRRMLGISD